MLGLTSKQQLFLLLIMVSPPVFDRSIALAQDCTQSAVLTGTEGPDTILGIGADVIIAYGGDDVVKAGACDDIVYGGDGNDEIDGGDGSDGITGENGDDLIGGGDGDDSISGGAGANTLLGGNGNDFLGGGDESDVLIGEEGNDWIRGEGGDDTIQGGDGHDSLYSLGGNDTIDGGNGWDRLVAGTDRPDQVETGVCVLTGGEGRDTFAFYPGETGHIVTDFVKGEDTLMLQGKFKTTEISLVRWLGRVRTRVRETEVGTEFFVDGRHRLTSDDFFFLQ